MGTHFMQKTIFFVGELWICNHQHLPPPTWSFATMMICPTNTWFFSTSMILSQQHMIFSHQHDPFKPKCCLIYSVNSSTIYGNPWKYIEIYKKIMGKMGSWRAIWGHFGPSGASETSSQHQFHPVWAPQDPPGPSQGPFYGNLSSNMTTKSLINQHLSL